MARPAHRSRQNLSPTNPVASPQRRRWLARSGNFPPNEAEVGERRPDGALESDILNVLWSGGETAMTPGEVNEALGQGLAYTTVMTVLTRLWQKGLLERVERGRAFAYRTLVSESELASRKMANALEGVADRASVLAGFVGSLSKKDVGELRRLLSETERRRR